MNCLFNNDFCDLSWLRSWWRMSKASVNISCDRSSQRFATGWDEDAGWNIVFAGTSSCFTTLLSAETATKGKMRWWWPSSALALATISWRWCVTAEREIRLNGLTLSQTSVQNFHILEFAAPSLRHIWSRVHPRLCVFLLMFSFRWLFWHLVTSSSL